MEIVTLVAKIYERVLFMEKISFFIELKCYVYLYIILSYYLWN
jgi:hypothetical protein